MGLIQPKPYKKLKDGKWVTVTPEPIDYKSYMSSARGGKQKTIKEKYFNGYVTEKP